MELEKKITIFIKNGSDQVIFKYTYQLKIKINSSVKKCDTFVKVYK